MTVKMTPKIKVATIRKVAAKKLSTPAKKVPARGASKVVSVASPKKKAALPAAKKSKPIKIKMVRDNYSMPESDVEKLVALKKKCLAAGIRVKKSELLRVGLHSILKLSNAALVTAVKRIKAQ